MINIAIDGFTGSGKSTLTRALATKLGDNFKVLDTGAIFRSLGYVFNKRNLGDMNDANLAEFLKDLKLDVIFKKDGQHVLIDDEDVTSYIRTEEVSQLASKVSVFACVREKYLQIAQNFAKTYDCIMEGRDIGTVVMPKANVKIFLTADEDIRAKRRFDELTAKGEKITYNEVLKDLKERDKRDSTRKIAPLAPTEDSVVVDNSDMNLDETVEYCVSVVNGKLKGSEKYINVTIDGYVCSGKSTLAKAIARKLGFKVFDTGAVYRGVACAFDYMHRDENLISEDYIKDFSKQINLKVEFEDGLEHVYVNGIDYTPFLRTERTSALSAKISPFTCIRDKVLKLQRNFAKENNLVMEGRDIGSYVLPKAEFKFFCTADEKVRAKRRFEQQAAVGNEVKFEDVLRELKERDYKDIHREHGAITKMPDSIVVDTTRQNLDQSVAFCLNKIKEKYPNIKIYK